MVHITVHQRLRGTIYHAAKFSIVPGVLPTATNNCQIPANPRFCNITLLDPLRLDRTEDWAHALVANTELRPGFPSHTEQSALGRKWVYELFIILQGHRENKQTNKQTQETCYQTAQASLTSTVSYVVSQPRFGHGLKSGSVDQNSHYLQAPIQGHCNITDQSEDRKPSVSTVAHIHTQNIKTGEWINW